MDRYVRVEDHPNLVRDRKTGAVLNIYIEEIKKKRQLKMLA